MLIAYRCWEVVMANDKPRLKSPHFGGTKDRFYWEPGETAALCERCMAKAKIQSGKYDNAYQKVYADLDIVGKVSPEVLQKIMDNIKSELKTSPGDFMGDCSCGLYSLASPELCIERGYTQGILGQIAIYGNIVVAEAGYRAEKAKVLNFIVPSFAHLAPEIIYALADEYQANIVGAEKPLYNMIVNIRRKSNPTTLKYGSSIHNQAAPTDKHGKEYWGERDTSFDFLNTGPFDQIDPSIHQHEVLPSGELKPRTIAPAINKARKPSGPTQHVSTKAPQEPVKPEPIPEPKYNFQSIRDRLNSLKK